MYHVHLTMCTRVHYTQATQYADWSSQQPVAVCKGPPPAKPPPTKAPSTAFPVQRRLSCACHAGKVSTSKDAAALINAGRLIRLWACPPQGRPHVQFQSSGNVTLQQNAEWWSACMWIVHLSYTHGSLSMARVRHDSWWNILHNPYWVLSSMAIERQQNLMIRSPMPFGYCKVTPTKVAWWGFVLLD